MADNSWTRASMPPSPMFTNKKEKDFVSQINLELTERIIGQQILYFPLSINTSNYHSLYGECLEKNYLPPVRVYCHVYWEGNETITDKFGINNIQKMTIHFFKKRICDDQDLFVHEGDVVNYGDNYFEIITLNEPQELWGQNQNKVEIVAVCRKVVDDFFLGEKEIK